MLKISDISEGLTDIIKKEMKVDETKAEQIEYGIYLFISETIKIAAVLILAAILDIFKYTVIAILVFGIHRGLIGGVHAKTHWGCFLSYNVIVFGTVFLSFHLNINKIIMALVLYPICMLIAYLYAPADILNKPVVSKKQRRYLRRGGFIFLTIVFTLAIFIPQPYSNILMIISIAVCIMMLPIIYKITGNEYGRKEVV